MSATDMLALSILRKENDSEVNSFSLESEENRLKFILLLSTTIDHNPFSFCPFHWLDTCQRQFISYASNFLMTVSSSYLINARDVHRKQRWNCYRNRVVSLLTQCMAKWQLPFLSFLTANMRCWDESSQIRSVLSSLTVAQTGKRGWAAKPQTSPSICP